MPNTIPADDRLFPMTSLLLVLWTAWAAPAAAAVDDATKAQIVDYALRTPTPDMDPKLADAFMDMDLEKLPKKKKEKARAKQLELQTLFKISKGKKKGGMRWPTPDGCDVTPYGPGSEKILAMAGFGEITDDEESFLQDKTKCTELELSCEFSLTLLLTPQKKGPPSKRYFLHENDPLGGLLAEYHGGKGHGQTKFFGVGVFSCNR